MRLARLLVFSGLAARAVADAAPHSYPPSRWSIYALTGGRYDAPTAAAAADAASSTRNVTNVQLWFHIMENFDELSLFGDIANNTKFTESAKVLDACTFIPEGYYGPFDYRNQRREPWQIFGKGITLLWLLRTVLNIYFFVSTLRYVSANWPAIKDELRGNYHPNFWSLLEVSWLAVLVVWNVRHFQSIGMFALSMLRDAGVAINFAWLVGVLLVALKADLRPEGCISCIDVPTAVGELTSFTYLFQGALLCFWQAKPSMVFRLVAAELNLNDALAFDRSAADPVATVALLPGSRVWLVVNACLAALGMYFASSKCAEYTPPRLPQASFVILPLWYIWMFDGAPADSSPAWVPWFRYLGVLRCGLLVYKYRPAAAINAILRCIADFTTCEVEELYAVAIQRRDREVIAQNLGNFNDSCTKALIVLLAHVVNYAVVVGMSLYFYWPTARQEADELAWFCLRWTFELCTCLFYVFCARNFERVVFCFVSVAFHRGSELIWKEITLRRGGAEVVTACIFFCAVIFDTEELPLMTFTQMTGAFGKVAQGLSKLKDRLLAFLAVYLSLFIVACVVVAIENGHLGMSVPFKEFIEARGVDFDAAIHYGLLETPWPLGLVQFLVRGLHSGFACVIPIFICRALEANGATRAAEILSNVGQVCAFIGMLAKMFLPAEWLPDLPIRFFVNLAQVGRHVNLAYLGVYLTAVVWSPWPIHSMQPGEGGMMMNWALLLTGTIAFLDMMVDAATIDRFIERELGIYESWTSLNVIRSFTLALGLLVAYNTLAEVHVPRQAAVTTLIIAYLGLDAGLPETSGWGLWLIGCGAVLFMLGVAVSSAFGGPGESEVVDFILERTFGRIRRALARDPYRSPYYPRYETELSPQGRRVVVAHQSITMKPAYRGKSFEELRLEDYAQGNTGHNVIDFMPNVISFGLALLLCVVGSAARYASAALLPIAALPSWTAYILVPLGYGWWAVTSVMKLFCESVTLGFASETSEHIFGYHGHTHEWMPFYIAMTLVVNLCFYFEAISANPRAVFLVGLVGKVLVIRHEFTTFTEVVTGLQESFGGRKWHQIYPTFSIIIAIDWLSDANALIRCLGAGVFVLLLCVALSKSLREYVESRIFNGRALPTRNADEWKRAMANLERKFAETRGDGARVGEPATTRPIATRSRPEPVIRDREISGEGDIAAQERERAVTRAESVARKAFLTAVRARAQAYTAATNAATASRRVDAERLAAAAEEERRAAAAAEAKRRAAKAERRARAEAEARAARAAEELIAAEEAAAAAAATKRSKKKKKKGRASSTTEPPPREEAKGEVPEPAPADPPPKRPETAAPAPAPAARRTLAELVAAEDAPAPPTETPPDSTILPPPLQDDVEADPAVAALLAKVGLERLAVDFAREQIDATTLPLLAVEDLVDVGLSTADAERVVAAVAPAPSGPGEVPENFCCPISMELMAQPVFAADGFTYDRASIEAWLARGKTTSPTTGAPLEHTHLTPNHLVKSMIAEYQESKG